MNVLSAVVVVCYWGFSFKPQYPKTNIYFPAGSQQAVCLGGSANRCDKTLKVLYGWGKKTIHVPFSVFQSRKFVYYNSNILTKVK